MRISEEQFEPSLVQEIDKIRNSFEKINNRMTDYFDMSSKEKNKSVPER